MATPPPPSPPVMPHFIAACVGRDGKWIKPYDPKQALHDAVTHALGFTK